ncbi:hypothetical protein MTP10_13850 [Nonomuraea sp. 3-1Str]|uniref:hypothetical protein n=1 Tax=Nonomuraea sp. 3-1Str TaxID=2929801 RepID=UPI00285BDD2D|nr:hypothetical protein [Nonomuraea sp. 3-1Str]MDR8409816.1 hypothetical protein [Nonomuraea sp. 3-1Str]
MITKAAQTTRDVRRPSREQDHVRPYADTWLKSRNHELATAARDASIMRNHVLARWRDLPLGKIDHAAVQAWITDLGKRLSPATVIECHRLLPGVMKSAVRDRLIGANPCEGVRLPKRRRQDDDDRIITREQFTRAPPPRSRPVSRGRRLGGRRRPTVG